MTVTQVVDDMQFVMPREISVFCPFPLRHHACDVAAIDEQAVQWCLRRGLCEPGSAATQMRCAAGIAPALPHAPDSTILAATTWFMVGSLLDDWWDKHPDLEQMVIHSGQLEQVMVAAPDAPLPVGERWAIALRDLRAQLETVLSDDEIVWFRNEFASWMNGQLWYSALNAHKTPPDIAHWMAMRWPKCGVATLLPFMPATMGCPLSARVLDEPPVRAFVEATMWATIVLNDLFSLGKERAAGSATTNLITVLAHHHGIGDEAALLEAWRLYERIVFVAWQLQQQLRSDPRPSVARLALDLPGWIPAGVRWAADTARYRRPSDSSVTHVVLSESPTVWDGQDRTAPPYEVIAWWWRHLR